MAKPYDSDIDFQFRLLVENVSDYAIFLIDPTGIATSWNPGVAKVLGYQESEFIGLDFSLLFTEEDRRRDIPAKELERARSLCRSEDVRWHLRKDGTHFWADGVVTCLYDGNKRVRGFAKVMRDRTQQRLAELRLEELTKDLAEKVRILDLTEDAIVIRELDGKILFWNQGAEKLYGWTRQEATGQNIHALLQSHFTPSLEEATQALTRDKRWSGEIRHIRKDGSSVIVASRWVIEPAATGTARVVESNTDISSRKEDEKRLDTLARELKQSNLELDRFAEIASHDLQEPMRMVTTYLQLFLKRFEPTLDSDGKEFLHFALDGALRMQQLIRQLLDYSRLGRVQRPFEKVDLNLVVQRARENLTVGIEESRAQIECEELPIVNGNPVLLIQLFQNLIGNAIKYRSSKSLEIKITCLEKEDRWHLSVADNGIGIDMRFAKQIFEPFRRLHSHSDIPGTGLGLAVCERIVTQHGGTIWAETAPGGGTIFTFTLPRG